MKRNAILVVLVLLLAGCSSCASFLTSQPQPWTMIQSVGGLRVDDPILQVDDTIFLPVICDVSGLNEVTAKPTTVNSALVVKKTTARIKEDRIQIAIVTCVVDNKHTSKSQGVHFQSPGTGTYQVEYLNPDGSTVELRTINIK